MPMTYVVGALLLLALALFVWSLLELRRARRGQYWWMRKASGQRGGQLFLISAALFASAASIAFFTGFAALAVGEFNDLFYGTPNPYPGIALPTPTYTPNFPTPDVEGTLNAIFTATGQAQQGMAALTQAALLATATPSPTSSPTPTPTITPTASPTPTQTVTPTATYDVVLNLTPPPSTIQPRRSAAAAIVSAALAISAAQRPISPAETFPAGVRRVYFFVRYTNMTDGIIWSRILYRDGVPVQGGTYTWTAGEDGEMFFFFGRADGYPPGNYEVRLFLGIAEFSRFRFTLTEN